MHNTSAAIRWLYCLAVAAAIFPFATSGWVAATLGGLPLQSIPFIGPILFLVIGIWRIYCVLRYRGTLDSYVFGGPLKVLRIAGIVGMGIAVVYLVARFSAGTILRSIVKTRTESGVEFYVVGIYLALLGGIAPLAIVVFEFSRLLGFERHANSRPGNS